MPTLLAALTRATNLLTHQFDERTVELGIGAAEYLVMRTVHMFPDASAAEVRKSLGMRDAAFSDVVRRTVYRGYATEAPYPGDRRTRRVMLTLPGRVAFGIASEIQGDLEAWLADRDSPATIAQLELVSHRLLKLGRAPRYADDLPAATA